MFYIVILTITLLLSFIKKTIKEKKVIDIIILLYMSIIYGIRYNVGLDYLSYQRHYFDITGFYGELDYLFEKLMSIFRGFSAPFWILNFFLGIVLFVFIYKISLRLNLDFDKVIIWFILTGGLFVAFNLVRQTIAGIIVLYSFVHIKNKRFTKYFIITIIAILIHFSSIIFIPFYFFDRFNVERKKWIILLLIGIALYLLNIVDFIFNSIVPIRYSHLIGGKYDYSVGIGLGVIFFIIVAMRFALSKTNKTDIIYPFMSTYILGYTLLLFTLNSFILTRVNTYSQMALFFILPYVFKKRSLKNVSHLINISICIVFVVIFIIQVINIETVDSNNLYYQTVFSYY